MGKIVDYKLTEEIAHGIYVSRLAREVARELHLSEELEDRVALAGLLHDIGKLKLASYLLKAQHSANEDHGIWSHHFMGNRWGNSIRLYFFGLQNHCRW